MRHIKVQLFLFVQNFIPSVLTTHQNILKTAQTAILSESESIKKLIDYLTPDFALAVEALYQNSGKLVVTGIGKSALIAQKIVATMNSTGTPAAFMHAAEAIHGDLGMIDRKDIVLCISKSGNSPEIKVLVPFLKAYAHQLIAMTGNTSSFLAKSADLVLNATVDAEACLNNLAPTNSTTAQLVLGDALSVCLMELRGFKAEDFARFHPGGALGKKLLLRVRDMLDQALKPSVSPEASIKKVIMEISEKRLGVTPVVENDQILGIITDGDIRRMLTHRDSFADLHARDIMTQNPKMIQADALVIDAFNLMEDNAITQVIVVEGTQYKGIIHLHDILKEGIV